jgi:cytochrome c-type biogenesis protein CcsB
MKKWLPIIVTGLMAAWFLSTLRPPKDETFAFGQFGKLPVVFSGRVQPMDSLARNSLLQIREKQEANLEPWKSDMAGPKMISATEWLATVMMAPATADQWPVFRVDNQELIALLKLPGKDLAQKQDGKYYSWAQIQPAISELNTEAKRIDGEKAEASQRTAYEKAVIKMRERVWLYGRLKNSVEPEGAENWAQQLAEYQNLIPAGVAAAQAQQAGKQYDEAVLKKFAGYVQAFSSMSQFDPPLVVPPHAGASANDWQGTGDALMDALRDGSLNPAVAAYAKMASAFQAGDAPEFNRQVVLYRESLAANFSHELGKAGAEVFFNRMQPFYNAMLVYVLALVLAFCFWLTFSETLRRMALWLVVWALIIHTTGLIFRMALEGRPPVTNLYSSAIFIGWGACVLGLVLESFWKNAIGLVVACVIGFITLIIAHFLALSGDTMEMMRAVLDTNIWLATHVVIVTLGYASTFVAGFLGILYIVLGFFTPNLTRPMSKTGAQFTGVALAGAVKTGGSSARTALNVSEAAQKGELHKSLVKMIYGIVCFATLFSFVGTVLGGIWADQSWGRFWGWDPKENGALIIVLWNALILHLRWGGMIRERGLATCAVIGNIVTSWSWFGVNMLGIGLHSYGFMDSAFYWLLAFVASQLALIVIGSLPLRMWKSFKGTIPPPVPGADGGTRGTSPATA